jgi:hypothetical protein
MYTNIPQDELLQIIQYALENSYTNYDTFITKIQNLIYVILEQNYFQFNNLSYKQTNKQTAWLWWPLLQPYLPKNHIIGYYRYVDNI